MSKKYTLQQVADQVISEGDLGYVIQHYLYADSIENPELAKLFREAKVILDKIDKILGPFYENE
jgi:hypothetical protein